MAIARDNTRPFLSTKPNENHTNSSVLALRPETKLPTFVPKNRLRAPRTKADSNSDSTPLKCPRFVHPTSNIEHPTSHESHSPHPRSPHRLRLSAPRPLPIARALRPVLRQHPRPV